MLVKKKSIHIKWRGHCLNVYLFFDVTEVKKINYCRISNIQSPLVKKNSMEIRKNYLLPNHN